MHTAEHLAQNLLPLEHVGCSVSFNLRVSSCYLVTLTQKGVVPQAANDILLPEEALERMLREIPDARSFEVGGANHHHTIMFQKDDSRNEATRTFLNG